MRKLALILVGFLALSANLQAGGISRDSTCEELLKNEWLTTAVALNIGQVANFPGNRAMASQQIMIGLIHHFNHPNLDFAYFEQYFRLNDVPLYLVASSRPLAPGLRVGYSNELGNLRSGPTRYHLWVGVGVAGKIEADALKASLGISDDENLVRLKETGFVVSAQTSVKRPFNPEDN